MKNKSPSNSYEDEKLRQLAESWLERLCKSGVVSPDSNPQRIADFLHKEGNEKLGLNIEIDTDYITEQLRITDGKIKRKIRSFHEDDSSSSSTSSSSTPPPPATAADRELGRQLFIMRQLQKTDISEHQNRLSMPCSQANDAVLTVEEAAELRRGVKVPAELVDPDGRRYEVNLRWTRAGKTSCSYAIGKPWNEIKRENEFRSGMVLNVWCFRGERGKLCFHLRREN